MLYRPTITIVEHHCSEHPGKLYPNGHSNFDRAYVDPDQPTAVYAATSRGATRL